MFKHRAVAIQSNYEKIGPVPFSVAASLQKMNYWSPFIAKRFRRFEHAFTIPYHDATLMHRVYKADARIVDCRKS